ncbi:MAG: FtsX-like permease family protein, partial [Acutalibacteraceae bacterium]|nr:FtsX-like permease family protein [Acutalibacteraceae bacterium]
LMEKQFNHMVYVLSFIIIAVVILNVARLYTYVMASRKKALAIFSVCGAGRSRIFALCTAEIGLTLLVSFGLGWLLFHFVLTEPITAIYPTFAEFFTPRIYLMLFGIYLVTGLIIMTVNIIPTIRQSIHDRTKGGE